MRTSFSIFLLVLMLGTNTPLGQLLKLPLLVEHLYDHKKDDGISLLEFFNDHYSNEHRDADQSEDDKLPFKTITLQSIGVAIVPGTIKAETLLSSVVSIKIMSRDI